MEYSKLLLSGIFPEYYQDVEVEENDSDVENCIKSQRRVIDKPNNVRDLNSVLENLKPAISIPNGHQLDNDTYNKTELKKKSHLGDKNSEETEINHILCPQPGKNDRTTITLTELKAVGVNTLKNNCVDNNIADRGVDYLNSYTRREYCISDSSYFNALPPKIQDFDVPQSHFKSTDDSDELDVLSSYAKCSKNSVELCESKTVLLQKITESSTVFQKPGISKSPVPEETTEPQSITESLGFDEYQSTIPKFAENYIEDKYRSKSSDRKGSNKIKCNICKINFTSENEVLIHKEIDHPIDGSYKCSLCSRGFASKFARERHKLTHSNTRPFKCLKCERAFYSKKELVLHESVHENDRRYKCEKCGRELKHHISLVRHKRNCELPNNKAVMILNCDQCEETFKSKSTLTKHKRKHAKPESPKSSSEYEESTKLSKYICRHCCKSFKTEDLLNNHLKKCKFKKSFVCEHCQRTFHHKGTFNRHQLKHSNERPYKCDLCKSTFKSKYDVAQHKVTHSRILKFECDKCHKTFKTNPVFKRHLLTHKTEK